MARLLTISEHPNWWLCTQNEDGLVCEQNVLIGLCRWDKNNRDYLDILEQVPDESFRWVTYPRNGCPKRVPEDYSEQATWPDGVPTKLSGGSYPVLEEGEDWADAISRKFGPVANARLFPALYLKLAIITYSKLLKDNPPDDIPIIEYIPEGE